MGTVRFIGREREDVVVEMQPDEVILAAAWRSGVEIPFKCTEGHCAWCTKTIRAGLQNIIGKERYKPYKEDGETRAKTCQMKVAEDGEVVIEL